MLKKELLLIAAMCSLFTLNAQIKNNLKLTIEPGVLLLSDSDNLGIFLYAEPKLKVSKNAFFGLRIGLTLNPQSYEIHDRAQFKINERDDNGGVSFVPTIDYYFKGNNYRPYVGGGVGAYLLSSYIDVTQVVSGGLSDNEYEVFVNNQVGLLLRAGFESKKSRLGLEYNFISKADIEIPNGPVMGSVDNSYLGLTIGFVIGGEKRYRG